ncbi:MAG: DUF3842 family protein [Oscillospiraceae bacterium]|jgi:hypothetical protein|nr:DUF3842 family protein [Oscillospiraceae bacterium]
MKIAVIDGQGGRLGAMLTAAIKSELPGCTVAAVGTNSLASSAMLKAGADTAASGENPAVVACRDADAVVGPIGIAIADSLAGEVTPRMAMAVARCPGLRVLLPINRCSTFVACVESSPAEQVRIAVEQLKSALSVR